MTVLEKKNSKDWWSYSSYSRQQTGVPLFEKHMNKLKAIIVDGKKSLILQIRCNALSQQASPFGAKG